MSLFLAYQARNFDFGDEKIYRILAQIASLHELIQQAEYEVVACGYKAHAEGVA